MRVVGIIFQNWSSKAITGPDNFWAIDGIGCPGRVERERLWVLGHPHFGIVTVVWNSFSGAEGRDTDRLHQLARKGVQSYQQASNYVDQQDLTRLGWLPLSKSPPTP